MITCADLEEVVSELALGQLAGEERADALEHLESCASCRLTVEELSAAVESLVVLTPPAEPPPGFEARVLAQIGREARARRWPRIVLVAAALVVGALIGGGALALRPDRGSPREVVEVAMHTTNGQEVGEAYLHQGDSAWVFVDVPAWSGSAVPGNYSLRITTEGGGSTLVPADFESGSGSWGTTVDVDASKVRELALVDGAGHVWCSATVPA